MGEDMSLVVFDGKEIRRKFVEGKWVFSVVDIIGILTESPRPRKYWSDLKVKLIEEGFEVSAFIGRLKLLAEDGKLRDTDVADTEGIFRIIQSIPSKKAEPFKRWLAMVGGERIKEISNPELAQERMKELYEKKGYSKDWIDKRLRGIAVRQGLTDEWKSRGVGRNRDFAILTAEISKATFGMTPSEYKDFKNLDKENLRDHMDDLELIFSMLGEASTTRIVRAKDSLGFGENQVAAREGGEVAGNARRELEGKTGEKVARRENFLDGFRELGEKRKRLVGDRN